MSVDVLLSRLERVRRTADSRWVAMCPSHASKSKCSLRVRELEDGRVLLFDFGGCSTQEILSVVGLEFSDLYPDPPLAGYGNKRERRPFTAGEALRCIAGESTYVAVVAGDIARGETLSDVDRERLLRAAGRINTAFEVCGCR